MAFARGDLIEKSDGIKGVVAEVLPDGTLRVISLEVREIPVDSLRPATFVDLRKTEFGRILQENPNLAIRISELVGLSDYFAKSENVV